MRTNQNPYQDGSQASRPHWAKWSGAYVEDADAKMKAAFADRLPQLLALSKEWDPNGVFVNKYFENMFSGVTAAS